MSKVKAPNFDLEDDEVVTVIDTKAKKKVSKKAQKKSGGPSKTVSVRLPTDQTDQLEAMNVDVPDLFRKFIEKEVLGSKLCPTCHQELKKGKH